MTTITKTQRRIVDSILDYAQVNNVGVGGKLPSIRVLSKKIGVSHTTAVKAVQHLFDRGVIEKTERSGIILAKNPAENPFYRIVEISFSNNNDSVNLSLAASSFLFNASLRRILPEVEILSTQYSVSTQQDLIKEVRRLIDFYYGLRETPSPCIFLLSAAPLEVKRYIQDNMKGIPVLVCGGLEPGIEFANVTVDTKAVMEQLFNVLNKGGRFPVVFAVNAEKLIGESLEYYKHFEQEIAKPANRGKMSIMRFSSSLDIFSGQMTQLFTNRESMPKVLIVQSDDAGIRALRVCISLGLKVPSDIEIISLCSGELGKQSYPSIAGFCVNNELRAQMVAEMVPQVINDPIGSRSLHRSYQSVLAFRDSFKNPYLVK